jgi:putative spermidine/putrescine transport system permease protein
VAPREASAQARSVAGRPRIDKHRTRTLRPYLLLLPATAIVFFLLLGTGYLLRYSFDGWDTAHGMYPAFTLDSYREFFTQAYYLKTLVNTLRLALMVTAIALVLGYPIAYLMAVTPRYRNLILVVLILPLITDVVVRAYGWIVLLSNDGPVNKIIMALGLSSTPVKLIFTDYAVIAEILHETLAFMILPIAAVLQKIDPSLREASSSLGASRWSTFWLITFPLSLPGVFAGTLLVFALGVSAFVGPLVLGGGNVTVMSLLIRDQMGVTLDWPLGSVMAMVLVVLTLLLLFFYGRFLSSGTGESFVGTGAKA